MEFQVYLDAPMFKLFKKEGGGGVELLNCQ